MRSEEEGEKELYRRGRDVDEEDEDELPRKRGKEKKKVNAYDQLFLNA